MKQFIGGLVLGIGIGLLMCALVAGSIISDVEYTLTKYDRHIDNFYTFTHSYGFETVRDLVNQTTDFYRSNALLRQTLETFGMGQLGQLFQDLDDNFQEIIHISEDMYTARSTVREVSSQIQYVKLGGVVLIIAGVIAAVWAFRQ
jgi:hypothetical protein